MTELEKMLAGKIYNPSDSNRSRSVTACLRREILVG